MDGRDRSTVEAAVRGGVSARRAADPRGGSEPKYSAVAPSSHRRSCRACDSISAEPPATLPGAGSAKPPPETCSTGTAAASSTSVGTRIGTAAASATGTASLGRASIRLPLLNKNLGHEHQPAGDAHLDDVLLEGGGHVDQQLVG